MQEKLANLPSLAKHGIKAHIHVARYENTLPPPRNQNQTKVSMLWKSGLFIKISDGKYRSK